MKFGDAEIRKYVKKPGQRDGRHPAKSRAGGEGAARARGQHRRIAANVGV